MKRRVLLWIFMSMGILMFLGLTVGPGMEKEIKEEIEARTPCAVSNDEDDLRWLP